jgi:outer membrane protein OmpA-like peptidoglycan-associated protein
MDVEVVRVVGYSDTVGGADGNQHLSLLCAGSIAALLEDIGVPRDRILIVGRGEEGVPEPAADHISEPLNRCAGIFVVPALTQ